MSDQKDVPTAAHSTTPVPITAMAASNSKAVIEAYYDKCREFGERAAKGDTSRVGWLLDSAERTYRKEIGKDEIGPGYDAFQKSLKTNDPFNRRNRKENTGKARAVRISECVTVCMVAGGLPGIDGLKAINAIMKVIKDNPQLDGETDTLLLRGCRAQKRSPTVLLKHDELLHAMQPKDEKPDRSEADHLFVVAKRIEWIATNKKSGFGWAPHTRSAYSSVNARIKELGGTTAEQKRAAAEAKKKAKASASKKKV